MRQSLLGHLGQTVAVEHLVRASPLVGERLETKAATTGLAGLVAAVQLGRVDAHAVDARYVRQRAAVTRGRGCRRRVHPLQEALPHLVLRKTTLCFILGDH